MATQTRVISDGDVNYKVTLKTPDQFESMLFTRVEEILVEANSQEHVVDIMLEERPNSIILGIESL
jgi:hypothetical protein